MMQYIQIKLTGRLHHDPLPLLRDCIAQANQPALQASAFIGSERASAVPGVRWEETANSQSAFTLVELGSWALASLL